MKLFTYIVNMAMDTHKRKFMEAQLQGIQNLDIHWLNAINGKKLTDHQIEESVDLNLFKSRIGREFTLPEIGCTLSHKKIYQDMCQRRLPIALVLEDDTILDEEHTDNILKIARMFLAHSKPLVILLNPDIRYYKSDLVKKGHNYTIYKMREGVQTSGYLINFAAAHLLCGFSEKIYYFADDWALFLSKGLTLYGCVPHQISLRYIESSIYDDIAKLLSPSKKSFLKKIQDIMIFRFKWILGRRFSNRIW